MPNVDHLGFEKVNVAFRILVWPIIALLMAAPAAVFKNSRRVQSSISVTP